MAKDLKLRSDEVIQLRTHYQGAAHDVLLILWRRKLLIILFLAAGLACGFVATIMLPPRYKSEAILHVNFSRDEPNTETRTQRIASMEAGALVESTARLLRSRAVSSAVVSRLGLDNSPAFTTPPRMERTLWSVRHLIGLPVMLPSAHDIAVDRLSGMLEVNIVPRSYIITIAVNAGEPTLAARLANAVVLEYWRSTRIQQMIDVQQGVGRDMLAMATLYGPRHPRTLDVQERSRDLSERIAALRKSHLSIDSALAEGGDFVPAEPVMVPSGPSVPIVLALALAIWLLICAGVIALLELPGRARSRARLSTRLVETVPASTVERTPQCRTRLARLGSREE